MVDFWGWIGIASTVSLPIAGGVIAGALVMWQELRKQSNKFTETKQELDKLNNFFKSIIMSQIYEKIAMLNSHIIDIPKWQDVEVKYKTNKIAFDLRAIRQMKDMLDDSQREQLRKTRDEIIKTMNDKMQVISR